MHNKQSEKLKDLYKGEYSAAETYKQALSKIDDTREQDVLMPMQKDHLEAVKFLGDHLKIDRAEKPDSSGAWGAFAKTVMGTAKVFGDKAALKALKEGEEHGLKEYNEALKSDLDATLKKAIESKFIPRQKEHIHTIDRLIANA